MLIRYAYIVDGETLWGPGAMPYFIDLKDGTRWEISAHSVEESEAVGVYLVEQINYRPFDERFERSNFPVYEVVNGRPRETWSYVFIPAARENMIIATDEYAEKMREKIITGYPGQLQEYNETYKEALEVKALPLEESIPVGRYPYLDGAVGSSYSETLGRYVETVRESADLVIQIREFWFAMGASIRSERLKTKKLISTAESDEEAFVIYNEFVSRDLGGFAPTEGI